MPAPAAGPPSPLHSARPRAAPPTSRWAYFGAGFAAAAALAAGYTLFLAPPLGVRVSAPPPRPTVAPLVVQVAGEVRNPGVVEVASGSRVDDALRAAGGPTEAADLEAVNLAARLADGQRLVVPRVGAASAGTAGGAAMDPAAGADAAPPPTPPPGSRAQARSPARINLNTASPADLDTLPGIGPAIAQRIVEQRRKAPFTSVEQLLELKLVNAATFARIKDLVGVE